MKEKQKHLTMKELPVTERPYEKCEKNGAGMLSDAELLAIVIKTGTRGDKVMDLAVQLLNLNPSCQGLEGIMSLDIQDFQKIRGIGRVKAVQLAAVCELSRRIVAFFFHLKILIYLFYKNFLAFLYKQRNTVKRSIHSNCAAAIINLACLIFTPTSLRQI